MTLRALARMGAVLILIMVWATPAPAVDYSGRVKAAWWFLDEEGHSGVNQPTFNANEGLALSLQDFNWRLKHNWRIRANLEDLGQDSPRLFGSITQPGKFGLTLRHTEYTRVYGTEYENSTERKTASGDLWVKPHRYVRLFGGYGFTDKSGFHTDLFGPEATVPQREVDYGHTRYHAGIKLTHHNSSISGEFRGSKYSDDLNAANDRQTQRFKVAAALPIPRHKQVWLNAGFQHYQSWLLNLDDSLSANTVWGGLRVMYGDGYLLRYSAIWDRARRTRDLAASDNIAHAVYVGKTWRGQGGLTLGYRHSTRDAVSDSVTGTGEAVFDALKTDGFSVSGWAKPHDRLTIRGSAGTASTDVDEGSVLVGSRDYARLRGSATYRLPHTKLRVRAENRNIKHDDIGSEADYSRAGADLTLTSKQYGTLTASYSWLEGDFKNAEGRFSFSDHIVSADAASAIWRQMQVGLGGSYLRNRQYVDIERFSVRVMALYRSNSGYTWQATYSAHNFDDLLQANTAIYTDYYTANIVELSITKDLGI